MYRHYRFKNVLASLLLLCFCFSIPALSQPSSSIEARLTEIESREQIRNLMKKYGRHLDLRDFSSFANLFTEADSTYISGGQTATGAKAIGEMLEAILTANALGLKTPNFHVFFNEVIEFNNPSEATAFSQSAYIVPGVSNSPEMVFFASYEDIFIIEAGQWKFKQRIVIGNIP